MFIVNLYFSYGSYGGLAQSNALVAGPTDIHIVWHTAQVHANSITGFPAYSHRLVFNVVFLISYLLEEAPLADTFGSNVGPDPTLIFGVDCSDLQTQAIFLNLIVNTVDEMSVISHSTEVGDSLIDIA